MQESGDNSLMRGLWTMESLLKLNLGPTNQHQEFYNPSAQEKCLRLLELLGHQFKHKIIGLLKQRQDLLCVYIFSFGIACKSSLCLNDLNYSDISRTNKGFE